MRIFLRLYLMNRCIFAHVMQNLNCPARVQIFASHAIVARSSQTIRPLAEELRNHEERISSNVSTVKRLFQATMVLGLMMATSMLALPAGASSGGKAVPSSHVGSVRSNVRPNFDCGWEPVAGPPEVQQEPQNVVIGAPYCFHWNTALAGGGTSTNECDFYTEWGNFSGAPYASLELASPSDCATNATYSGDFEWVDNTNNGTDGNNYGPHAFNTFNGGQALAPVGTTSDAHFVVCMFEVPGEPTSYQECLELEYNGT
jgi:hypothetical protein